MPSILLTGATGYIGGDFLHNITHQHPEWSITALIRTPAKADLVRKEYPKLNIVLGDNSSHDMIISEVQKADIIFHFAAAADDQPSAKAIAEGLSKSSNGTKYWIHTSGTYILTRPNLAYSSYGYDDGEDFDDWDGIEKLVKTMPHDAPHRTIDKIVLSAGSAHVKTAIVCPPTVYGPGRGPDNKKSMQAPQSAATILKNKKGFVYGAGQNPWYQVHVQDLTDLYVLLGEAAAEELAGKESKATWNQEGYYLAENGRFLWGDVLKGITAEARKRGFIGSEELEIVDASTARGKFPMTVGTTSKGIGTRAKKLLGWKPSRRGVIEEIPDIVAEEAAKLGLS